MSNEIKVGLFTIFSLFILYFGVSFFKNNNIFSSNNIYYSYVKNADNIYSGQGIYINGILVGNVQDVSMIYDDNFKIKVILSISKKISLTENTDVRIKNSLLGNSSIKLDIKQGKILPPKSEIILLDDNDNQISNVLNNVTNLTDQGNQLLNFINLETKNISSIIDNLNKMTRQMNDIIYVVGDNAVKITSDLKSISNYCNNRKNKVDEILSNFDDCLLKINNLPLDMTLNNIDNLLQKVSGGPLCDDKIFANVNENVNKTINSLNNLLIDVKTNPKRYVHFSIF